MPADIRVEEPAVDRGLINERHAAPAQVAADAADQSREWPPLAAEPGLQALAQSGGQERALPLGGDGDQERIAAHDGRGDEPALVGPVENVEEYARRLGLGPGAGVDFGVAAGIDHDSGAGEDAVFVLVRCEAPHAGAGLGQQRRLLVSQVVEADHNGQFAGQVEKDGIVPHAPTSRRRTSEQRAATASTNGTILGCSGWTAARSPCSPRAAVVVGPIDAIWVFCAKALATRSARR